MEASIRRRDWRSKGYDFRSFPIFTQHSAILGHYICDPTRETIVTPRSLQSVLRILSDTGSPVPDADLLRRFHEANDDAAFAELVRRHGRLVWAVCRHLTRSDAEADDAFQATFLVLLKNATKVRDAGKLSAWLHGVAYRVCSKSRSAAQRRTAREQAGAIRERSGSAVPDSAWDRALAAVHDEVAKLPETLRVPFVLCCLEGIGATEAAQRLGWKLGTLSGRLTRAKDAVLAKLEARGLTMGVVASVGLVSVPTAVAAKASALAQVGFAIPGSILQLSQGVIGMSLKPVKLLAAAVILTCGLGLSVGTGWVTNAEAQSPVGPPGAPAPSKADPAAEVKRLQTELDRAKDKANAEAKRYDKAKPMADTEDEVKQLKANLEKAIAAEQAARQELRLHLKVISAFEKSDLTTPDFKTMWWEYDLVDMAATFDKAKFGVFLQEREATGWEFLGSTTLGKSGGVFQWLFRRPVKGAALGMKVDESYVRLRNPKVDDAKSIEAEIKKLQEKLKSLQSVPVQIWIGKENLPADPPEFAAFLTLLANKKFGPDRIKVIVSEKGFHLEGNQEVLDWARGVIGGLSGNNLKPLGR